MSPKAVNGPFKKLKNKPNKFKKEVKRNQRFFANVKSFARKGNHGRGTHIDEDDFAYYLGILETQQSKRFQSTDEKVAMANNVMQETKTKEIHVSSNQVVSRVLENVLGYADAEHLERFFDVFGEGMRPLCSDDHAKHVINKLLEIAFIRARAKSVITKEDENGVSSAKKPRFEVVTELKFNLSHDFTDEHREKCSEFVLRISKFLLNNLEDFAEDKNANHLIRTAMLSLAGIYIPSQTYYKGKLVPNVDKYTGLKILHRVGKFDLLMTTFNVSDEWLSVMNEFPERIQMWPQFKDFPYKFRTSALIQTMCIVLSHANKPAFESLGMKLVNECFVGVEVPMSSYYDNDPLMTNNVGNGDNDGEEKKSNGNDEEADADENENEADEHKTKLVAEEEDDDRPSVFKSEAGVRLLETLIPLATPKLKTEIIKLYEGRLLALAFGKMSTFAVVRLINYADKSNFEQLFDEISPNFVLFLQKNQSSVVAAITAVCLRLKMKQAACITALQNALHCTAAQSKSFFACLIKLKPVEVLPYDQETYVSLNGSLIIQDILQFNKPILLVNSILESPIKFLVEFEKSLNGIYIADVFLTSPAIGEKSREKFVKLFEGFYIDLAVTQCGSIVIEKFVKSSNDTIKVAIAKELVAKDNKLKGSKFGRIIYKSLRLETFNLSPEQWKASFNVKAEAKTKTETKPAKEEDAADEENGVEESQEDTKTVTTPKTAKKNKKSKKRPAEAKTETETKPAKEEDAADEENGVEESREDTNTVTTPKPAKKNKKSKKRPAEGTTETETKPAKEEDAADEENGVEESQEDTKTVTTPKPSKKNKKNKKRPAEAKTENETKPAKEEDAADEENGVEESQEDTKTVTTPKPAKKNKKSKKRPAS